MRRILLCSAVVLAGHTTAASAQQHAPMQHAGIKLSDVTGTWDTKSMVGPKDSVVVEFVVTATADRKGWTFTFLNRAPIPTRVLAVGGDSIVTEAGPYPSVLRPGQMVTTRTTGHYKGDTMTGTFVAHYASGDVLKGKIVATRRK